MHIPCSLKIPVKSVTEDEDTSYHKRPAWLKATEKHIQAYQECLETKLNIVQIQEEVVRCSDIHCKNVNHIAHIDTFCEEVINAVPD